MKNLSDFLNEVKAPKVDLNKAFFKIFKSNS